MKLFTAIATAAVIGGSLFTAAPEVKAEWWSTQYGTRRGNTYDFGSGGRYQYQNGNMYRYGSGSGFGTQCRRSSGLFPGGTSYSC